MQPYAQAFARYLTSKGYKYTQKEDRIIEISFRGENLNSIDVFVFFDKDGDPLVSLKCWEIANFKNNERIGMEVCNQLNAEYRWVKFYIDDDKDVIAETDGVLSMDTCGEHCLFLVKRVINIVDDVYPRFAKARWA